LEKEEPEAPEEPEALPPPQLPPEGEEDNDAILAFAFFEAMAAAIAL